jgi:hypothetical protein
MLNVSSKPTNLLEVSGAPGVPKIPGMLNTLGIQKTFKKRGLAQIGGHVSDRRLKIVF